MLVIAFFLFSSFSNGYIRGVSPEDEPKYLPDADGFFHCLSNPSVLIPKERVNDNYCDCPDGSDEPGTAACASLFINPSNDFPEIKFYCPNKGGPILPFHNSPGRYLPLNRVDDGACDYNICCDGSDENDGNKNSNKKNLCPNKCAELATEYNNALKIAMKTHSNGLNIKKKWLNDVKNQKISIEKEIKSLESDLEQETKILSESKQEAERLISKTDSFDTSAHVEKLSNNVEEAINELTTRMLQLEDIVLSVFSAADDSDPVKQQEAAKRASEVNNAYKEKYTVPIREASNQKISQLKAEISSAFTEALESAHIFYSQQLEAQANSYANSRSFPSFSSLFSKFFNIGNSFNFIKSYQTELHEYLVKNGFLAQISTSSQMIMPTHTSLQDSSPTNQVPLHSSHPKAQGILRSIESAEQAVSSISSSLESKKSMINTNFGPDDIFFAKGAQECIIVSTGEYNYELCPYKDAYQVSNNDGVRTLLGSHASFDLIEDDGRYSSDPNSILSSVRIVETFDNGAKCWNGPKRSLVVYYECGDNSEIISVLEPEKCVYKVRARTPAACSIANISSNDESKLPRDENEL